MSSSPPRAIPIKYDAPLGTRWDKEKAAAGGSAAFDLPTDPTSIGPWIIGECIGKGASGRVKIARHKHSGQLAAVKILPLAPLVNSRQSISTRQAKQEKQRLGIDREITMMKLMNHPNIMRIYDVYEGSKELFLVLEYVEGGELFDFLVNHGRLASLEALAFFKQIIYGLNYAHTFSIIHRDLKPENILIASLDPPVIKIADWGMAAFAPPTLQLETSCGSPHYASPEIVNGEKYQGNATDIWSCGVILYALLTGRLPFDDKNVRTLLSKVKIGKYVMPTTVDPLAQDLIRRMLVVDVNTRITIPEILTHPWMRSDQHFVALTPSIGRISNPPLPPSPSTLAKPITSSSEIDMELLSSLKIIWGRHADPSGDTIKHDLCSPIGHGIHAKAFYFLLRKYRDETAKNITEDGAEDGATNNRTIESVTFNLGWDLDTSSIGKQIGAPQNSDFSIRARSKSYNPEMRTSRVADFVRPTMNRHNSTSRERPSSPVGPRNPRVDYSRARQSFVIDPRRTSANPPAVMTPPDCDYQPQFTLPHPRQDGSRPPMSRRVLTYSHPQPIDQRGSVLFSCSSNNKEYLTRRLSSKRPTQRPSSASGVSSQSQGRRDTFMAPPSAPKISPVCISQMPALDYGSPPSSLTSTGEEEIKMGQVGANLDDSSSNIADLPQPPLTPITAPKTPNLQLQKQMDDLASKVNELLKVHSMSSPRVNGRNAPGKEGTPRGRGDDKENMSFSEEGWSNVGPDEGRSPKVGLGLGVGRGAGNIVIQNSAKGRKDKKDKHRPPPLDFPSLNRKRSALSVLPSPTVASPVLLGSVSVQNGRVSSPVVGEFKGWFSNLFGIKSNPPSPGTGILYSSDDLSKTRLDIGRVLQSWGIIIEGTGFTHPPSEAAVAPRKEDYILRCRSGDGNPVLSDQLLNYKHLRFRVELSTTIQPQTESPDIASPTASGHSAVRSSFGLKSSPYFNMSDEQTVVIMLIQEKGSVTTFKALCKKLKDVYQSGSTISYPCVSPTVASPNPW